MTKILEHLRERSAGHAIRNLNSKNAVYFLQWKRASSGKANSFIHEWAPSVRFQRMLDDWDLRLVSFFAEASVICVGCFIRGIFSNGICVRRLAITYFIRVVLTSEVIKIVASPTHKFRFFILYCDIFIALDALFARSDVVLVALRCQPADGWQHSL